MPAGFTIVDTLGTVDGQNITWNVATLESGKNVTFTIVVRTNATGNWTNVVNVNSKENNTDVGDSITVEVVPVNVTVIKTADVTVVGNNTLVNFTIVVKNTGRVNATDVVITDLLPDGFVFVNATEGYVIDVQKISWNISNLSAGDVKVYTIVVRTNAVGNLTNVVYVTSVENETVVMDDVTVEIAPVDLTVNKTASVNTISVNEEITFTINVKNNAPVDATNVTITDVVPTGFEFVSSSDGYNEKTGILTIPIIKAGESYVFTITLKAIMNGTLTNVVNVICGENDTVVTTSVNVNVTPVVNLTVVKVAGSDDAAVDDEITFTITVTNNGPSNATNIKVIDILDDGFTLVSGDLETVIPFLECGDSVNIVVKVITTAKGTYTNRVIVTCDENNTVKSANASVHVYNTDLKINKTAAQTNVSVNGLVNFTIVVKNHGKINATNVSITDILDDAFEFVDANGTYTRNGQTIIWTFDSLSSEETTAVWVLVKALTGGTFENIAHINCSEEGTIKNSTATVKVINPSIAIVTTADDEFVYSGNQTRFIIKITNDGEVTLTGVNIHNVLSDGIIYDHFTGSNWTYDGDKFIYSGSLGVGESAELIIVVNTTLSGKFIDNATVSSDQTGNVSDDDSVLVYTSALSVREISNNPLAYVGQTVSFTVVVTNIGDCELTGVYTINNFPEGLIYIGYDGDNWDKVTSGLLEAPAGSWIQNGDRFDYLGTLKPGESGYWDRKIFTFDRKPLTVRLDLCFTHNFIHFNQTLD